MAKFVVTVLLVCCVLVVISAVYIDPFGNRHHRTHDGRRNNRRRDRRLEAPEGQDGEERGQTRRHHRHKWHRWLPDWMTKRHKGKTRLGPWQVDFDLDNFFNWERSKPWWKGPNVCQTEEVPVEKSMNQGWKGHHISHHLVFRSTMCDDTGSVYKCTTTDMRNGRSTTTLTIKACCHGYRRQPGKIGCSEELELNNTIDTMLNLGATEFVRALKNMDLLQAINTDNHTIFSPSNEAFKQFKQPFESDGTNTVEITREMVETAIKMQQILTGHVIEGWMPTKNMEDEHVIQTTNTDARIRINFYSSPKKLMTANCATVTSTDNMATNGIIHIIDKVLIPVEDSLLMLVSKDPQLSTLKTILARSGLSRILKENKALTLFAPTNAAFDKLEPRFRHDLLTGHACLTDIIKNHILPNVICSGVLEGKAWARNMLGRQVSLRKDKQTKLFFEKGQIIKTDVMGSNGVLHLIDSVSVPNSANNRMSEVLRKAGARKFLELMEKSNLTSFLDDADNITVFVPTDKAIQEVPTETLRKLENSPSALMDVLKYHIVPGEYKYSELQTGTLPTLQGKHALQIYSFVPNFSFRLLKTVQCARFLQKDVTSCNGAAHFIDKLLLPPSGDLISVLADKPNYSTVLDLFKKTGLDVKIKNGNYTIIAPSNQAFSAIKADKLDQLKQDVDGLKKFLHHYLIEGVPMCCASLNQYSLAGGHLAVTRWINGFLGNLASIKQCDTMATNGIIHGINRVLPEEVRKYIKQKPKPLFDDGVLLPGLEDTPKWIDRLHTSITNEDVPAFDWSEEFYPDGGDFMGL